MYGLNWGDGGASVGLSDPEDPSRRGPSDRVWNTLPLLRRRIRVAYAIWAWAGKVKYEILQRLGQHTGWQVWMKYNSLLYKTSLHWSKISKCVLLCWLNTKCELWCFNSPKRNLWLQKMCPQSWKAWLFMLPSFSVYSSVNVDFLARGGFIRAAI